MGGLDYLRLDKTKTKHYRFDFALGPTSTQTEVYEKTNKPLVEKALQGYNACCFAYGASITSAATPAAAAAHCPPQCPPQCPPAARPPPARRGHRRARRLAPSLWPAASARCAQCVRGERSACAHVRGAHALRSVAVCVHVRALTLTAHAPPHAPVCARGGRSRRREDFHDDGQSRARRCDPAHSDRFV